MTAVPKLPPANFVDRLVNYVSPTKGLERMRDRAQMALVGQWTGGRTDRRPMWNWMPALGSADADNLSDLPNLRRRSRELQRSNPLAIGAINTNVTSIVGTGLALRSRIDSEMLGMSSVQAQAWQRTAEREFRLWAENPIACDSEATLSFYALQALALRSALESGDVLATLPWVARGASPYQLKIRLIEADRLCNSADARDTDELSGGVHRDGAGAPDAYHILRSHPYGLVPAQKVWDVVPAFGKNTGRRNVLHLFDKRRPGQTRGMPYLSPVIESLRQYSEYTNAELQAAVISAFFTVFIKSPGGDGLGIGSDGGAPTSPQSSGSNIKLGAGAIVDLAEGEDIVTADPKRPNVAFDGFVTAMAREIGVALELPYEVLIKHFESSYSAARAAIQEAWRFFMVRRAWLAEMFCQPVYEAFIEEAVARGRIDAPGYFEDPMIRVAYLGTEWIGDGQTQLDPEKEVAAAKARIDARLSTHKRETAALTGADWADEHEQLAGELKVMDAAGTTPPAPAAAAPVPRQQQKPETK